MAWTVREAGAGIVLPTVAAEEDTDRGMYDQQPETEQTTMRADERSPRPAVGHHRLPDVRG